MGAKQQQVLRILLWLPCGRSELDKGQLHAYFFLDRYWSEGGLVGYVALGSSRFLGSIRLA